MVLPHLNSHYQELKLTPYDIVLRWGQLGWVYRPKTGKWSKFTMVDRG